MQQGYYVDHRHKHGEGYTAEVIPCEFHPIEGTGLQFITVPGFWFHPTEPIGVNLFLTREEADAQANKHLARNLKQIRDRQERDRKKERQKTMDKFTLTFGVIYLIRGEEAALIATASTPQENRVQEIERVRRDWSLHKSTRCYSMLKDYIWERSYEEVTAKTII